MNFTETKSLNPKQLLEIISLWNQEYPKKLELPAPMDFERYLQGLKDRRHILLMDDSNTIKGWLVHFIRDGEKWFAMLIDSKLQGRGLGSQFLDLAKKRNTELNGWVIDHDRELQENGTYYKSPIGFYLKNGFDILPGIKLEKQQIEGIKIRWKKDRTIER